MTFSNQIRIITYQTNSEQQEFSYPPNFDILLGVMIENLDEPVASISVLTKADADADLIWQPWTLDLTTGAFAPYQTICNRPAPLTDSHFSIPLPYVKIIQQWSFYEDPATAERSLCYVATGEFRALPVDPEVDHWSRVYPSPTGIGLLIEGIRRSDPSMPQTPRPTLLFYGYQVATDTFKFIGSLAELEMYSLERWLTPTQPVILNTYMPQSWGGSYYVMDITQSASLRDVISRNARFFDDPPRYEALYTHSMLIRQSDPNGHADCTFVLYTATMIASSSHNLGYDCGGLTRLANGDYLYLSYPEQITTESLVYRLDPETDQRTLLATGEFEVMVSASPDGRYVGLIQHNNGKVDRADVEDWQFFSWRDMGLLKLIIMDTLTGEIRYQASNGSENLFVSPRRWDRASNEIIWDETSTNAGVRSNLVPVWLDNQTFILERLTTTRLDSGDKQHNTSNSLVKIKDNGIEEVSLDDVLAVDADDGQMLISQPGENFSQWILYNYLTGESLPILRIPASTSQQITMSRLGGSGPLEICIRLKQPEINQSKFSECYQLEPY